MPPHVLCRLRGPPSWAWQECNRLLRLGRPWGAVTLSRWCVRLCKYIHLFFHTSHYIPLLEFWEQRSCFAFGLHWSVYILCQFLYFVCFVSVFHRKISLLPLCTFLVTPFTIRYILPNSVPTTTVFRRAPAITSPSAVISGLSKHRRSEFQITREQTFTKGWDLGHGRKLITIIILLITSLCHPHIRVYKVNRLYIP